MLLGQANICSGAHCKRIFQEVFIESICPVKKPKLSNTFWARK